MIQAISRVVNSEIERGSVEPGALSRIPLDFSLYMPSRVSDFPPFRKPFVDRLQLYIKGAANKLLRLSFPRPVLK